jgi:hypothetical protein
MCVKLRFIVRASFADETPAIACGRFVFLISIRLESAHFRLQLQKICTLALARERIDAFEIRAPGWALMR